GAVGSGDNTITIGSPSQSETIIYGNLTTNSVNTTAGGTFATDITVSGIRIGVGVGTNTSNIII
ncbi:hypothetical protein EBV26_11355, partial [bacterium]|nr:hypothetical protein [bacterium]